MIQLLSSRNVARQRDRSGHLRQPEINGADKKGRES